MLAMRSPAAIYNGDVEQARVEGDPMTVRNYLVSKSNTAARALGMFVQKRDMDVILERS
jgi:hypothetical protein